MQERTGLARTGQQLRRRTATAVQERRSTGSSPRKAVAPKSDLGDKLRHWFDNSRSRGTPAPVAWLSVATLVLIVFFTAVTTVFGLRPDDDGGTTASPASCSRASSTR